MNLKERKELLIALGQHLQSKDEYLEAIMHRTQFNNAWFTIENQQKAVNAIATKFLAPEKLDNWLQKYSIPETTKAKKVGLIMAGNIPLVGFHDVLSVFISGHQAVIKLSEKDQYLLPYLISLIGKFEPKATEYFSIAPKLKDFEAVIATGSNNTARYFDAYFSKYPNIIRKNRHAVAVLNGTESSDDLHTLGKDVFQFFGLGCRNVAKVYVPETYDFTPLLEALHEYRDIVRHSKYKNNFDYNYALYVLNKTEHMANGCIILTQNKAIQSRIAGLHYEYYSDIEHLKSELKERITEIQCVVSSKPIEGISTIPFGKAQQPELWDYADGVDTMKFLVQL